MPKPLRPDILISVDLGHVVDIFERCTTDEEKRQVVLRLHDFWCRAVGREFEKATGESLDHTVLAVDINRNGAPAVLLEIEDATFWQCYIITVRRENGKH